MDNVPIIDESRDKWSFKIMKAVRHAKIMAKNPEDTRQVYYIRDALRLPVFYQHAVKFLQSPMGQEIYEREYDLASILDDPDRLSLFPVDTVGYQYYAFMVEEGLSAKGLVTAYDDFASSVTKYDDRVNWYLERQRDTHDLMHILTGYGRDNVGEQCLLGFSDSQCPSLGALFIAYVGGAVVRPKLPSHIKLFQAIKEGRRNGKKADIIAHQMIEPILHMPLDDARAMLNIAQPILYLHSISQIEANGVNPFDILQTQNKFNRS